MKLASGQDLFSQKLLIDPQFVVPQALASSRPDGLQGTPQNFIARDTKKVARGICITKTSLKSDASNLLIVIPPRCKIVHALPSSFLMYNLRENH